MDSESVEKWSRISFWFSLIEALSMDCATQFIRVSDLKLKHTNQIKEICRDYVRSCYDNSRLEKELLPSTLESLISISIKDGVDMIQELNESYDKNYPEAWNKARDWGIVLGRLANYFHVEDYPLIPLNLPEDKIMLLKMGFLTYIAKVNRFRLRTCEAKNEPLSEWDSYVYSKHLGKTDPLVWLERLIIFNFKVSQWKQIQDLLTTPDEVKYFEEWGINQAKIMGQESPLPSFVRLTYVDPNT